MDACATVLSTDNYRALLEQIAEHMRESVSGEDVFVAILCEDGQSWSSDELMCHDVIARQCLTDVLFTRIADGQDPIAFNVDGYCIVASQLLTPPVCHACVVIGFKGHSVDESTASFDLAMTLINQVNTIARMFAREVSDGCECAGGASSMRSLRAVCLN